MTAETSNAREPDVAMALHWIDRYAAGIDDECQIDLVADALGVTLPDGYATAPPPAAERGEWVLVPRNPTEAMLDAMHSRIRILCDPAARTADIQNDREVWAAMLAVSPPAPISVPLDRLTALDGLVDRIAEAIRDGAGLAEGDPPWERLGEERRAPWRADAKRALSVVKESLTAAGILAARTSQPPDAEVRALPAKWRDRAANNPGSFAAAANVVCADELEAALAAEGVQAGEVSAYDLAVLDDAAETLDRIGEGSAGLREARARIASALSQPAEARGGGEVVARGFYDPMTGAYSESQHTPRWLPAVVCTAPPSAPVGVELSALRVQEWLHREHDILCPVQEIEQAMRTPCSCPFTERALAQQPAAVDEAMELVRDIAEQKPEKPDYWSSCGQCESNIDRAQEVLAAQQQGGAM